MWKVVPLSKANNAPFEFIYADQLKNIGAVLKGDGPGRICRRTIPEYEAGCKNYQGISFPAPYRLLWQHSLF